MNSTLCIIYIQSPILLIYSEFGLTADKFLISLKETTIRLLNDDQINHLIIKSTDSQHKLLLNDETSNSNFPLLAVRSIF